MKTPESVQLFLIAYEMINTDHKKFKEYLNHKDINQEQKTLLKSVYNLKKNKPYAALELLQPISIQNDFLKTYRDYILGLVYNHIGQLENASVHLILAISSFDKYDEKNHLYKPISAILNVFMNMRNTEKLKEYYLVFKKFQDDSIQHQILDYNFKIYINLLEGDREKTLRYIDDLIKDYKEVISGNMKTYIIFRFMINIVHDDFDECYAILTEYKKLSGFGIKSNYKFMINLLNYYTKNAPLYAYQRDYSEVDSLYYQIKTIQSLDLKNIDMAKEFWGKLKINTPSLYKEDFNYTGQKDLFKICLTKAIGSVPQRKNLLDEDYINGLENNSQKLKYILDSSDYFLTKDKIIKLIWNEEWSPRNDQRLRTLMSRVLKKNKINVKNIDGKYKKIA